jgi:SAM-dependent methyltransferase
MNVSEYKIMYDLENDYWYYIALRDLIFSYFKKQYPNGNDLKILDAGCGTGALLENFIEHGYEDVKGMDISDKATQTGIRYSKDDLNRKLGLAGFKIERITYRNSFLFPLVMIYRILKKNSKTADESKSDLRPLPTFVNKTLIELLKIENSILNKFNFPFGSSIFCIAYKIPKFY